MLAYQVWGSLFYTADCFHTSSNSGAQFQHSQCFLSSCPSQRRTPCCKFVASVPVNEFLFTQSSEPRRLLAHFHYLQSWLSNATSPDTKLNSLQNRLAEQAMWKWISAAVTHFMPTMRVRRDRGASSGATHSHTCFQYRLVNSNTRIILVRSFWSMHSSQCYQGQAISPFGVKRTTAQPFKALSRVSSTQHGILFKHSFPTR